LSKFFYKVKQEDEKIGFFGENSKNEDNKSKKAIRLLFLAGGVERIVLLL